jgi:membrane associated rhomboid family serine protease
MAGVVTAAKHGNVNLDVCTQCQLAWFDPREFEVFPIVPANQPRQLPLPSSEAIALEEMRRDTERRRGPDYGADDGPDESWKWIPALFGLPVEEDASIGALPWLTWGLSAVLVMIFFLTWSNLSQAVHQFGLIPAQAWRLGGATLLTSFFIHGSLLHLFGNVYFLLVFGDNVENDIGRWRFAALLLVATLVGNLAHLALDVRPNVPCVGASGGIAGVLAYYALRFPRARICLLIGGYYYLYLRWIHVPAYGAFGLWIALQIVIAFVQTHAAGDVSGLAHLGGASVGLIAWALRRVFVGEITDK